MLKFAIINKETESTKTLGELRVELAEVKARVSLLDDEKKAASDSYTKALKDKEGIFDYMKALENGIAAMGKAVQRTTKSGGTKKNAVLYDANSIPAFLDDEGKPVPVDVVRAELEAQKEKLISLNTKARTAREALDIVTEDRDATKAHELTLELGIAQLVATYAPTTEKEAATN